MKEIILTQGFVALVDNKDYSSLMLFKWYAKESWKKEVENGMLLENKKYVKL